jgi:hypothetical protein
MKSNASGIFAFAVLLLSSGCSVLVGNIKPVTEHSDTYLVKDLSVENSKEWLKLPSTVNEQDTASSDASYQSKQTASIISINSACRPSNEENGRDLRYFTNLLLLGVTDVTYRNEAQITVSSVPALETTIQGKLSNEITKMRTVVVKMGQCVYDLMYISRPQSFQKNEKDFTQFVQSLRIK